MEDDILDQYLGSSDGAFESKVKDDNKDKKSSEFKSKGGNDSGLWNDTNIKKVRPDPANFVKEGKIFTVALAGTPDDKAQETMLKLLKVLASKNFVMRYMFDNNVSFLKTMADVEGLTKEAYLPWKKMAPDLASKALTFARRKAYEAASYYSPKFNTFPPAIRCIRSMAIHSLLGKDVNNPSNFLLCWSECGTEVMTRDTDFKKLGNNGNFLTPCKDLNIPVYNIAKEESLKSLIEYIKEN